MASIAVYGAKGDGVTDDAPAIQATLDYALSSGRRGEVWLSPGVYMLGATITLEGVSISLAGEAGEHATILRATHSDGPVVRVKGRRSGLQDLHIDATTERQNGSIGTGSNINVGVLVEADDKVGARPMFGFYSNLLVEHQPHSGMVFIGGAWTQAITRSRISENGWHGIVFDDGTLTGRENKEPPGIANIDLCHLQGNGGHGLLLGNDNDVSNRALRMMITNVDVFRNAAHAGGGRKSADQVWMFADSSIIQCCAFSGEAPEKPVATTRGMLVHGRGISIRNNRFLGVTPQAIRVSKVSGYATEGVTIEEMNITGELQAPLDPAVLVDQGISLSSVRVWNGNSANIIRLVRSDAKQRREAS